MHGSKLISVVVPCYNESEVLEQTHRRISAALSEVENAETEIIYVDDGSTDETTKILRKLSSVDPRAKTVLLSRNFGHQAAISAGLKYAAGDAVVLMDADLQDPPELIPVMVKAWQSGADVAYGVRTDRPGESRFKTVTARVFYRILNRLSDVKIPLDTGDFRLMDRRVVDSFLTLSERHRFVRGMVTWLGYTQTPIPYDRAPRAAGETKYPFKKMLRLGLDGIVSFSLVPLRVVTIMGFVASFLSFVGIAWALAARFFTDEWVPGWAATFIAILFMGGVQLISLGIIGEYVGRVYGEVKARPVYVVEDEVGFHPDSSIE